MIENKATGDAAPNHAAGDVYEFGPFQLDPTRRELRRNGVAVNLTPKIFDTLLVLVEDAGHLVTKEQLLARVWPDTAVEEGSLTNTMRPHLQPQLPSGTSVIAIGALCLGIVLTKGVAEIGRVAGGATQDCRRGAKSHFH